MRKADKLSRYFDEDGKQLKPLPAEYVQLSKRFKPGDTVRYLRHQSVYIGEEPCKPGPMDPTQWKSLQGEVGIVVRVNDGRVIWPHQRWIEEHECWLTDSLGWLTVRFPFDVYGREADGTYKPRALHPEDEGGAWRATMP